MDYKRLVKQLVQQLRHVQNQRDHYNRELLVERSLHIRLETAQQQNGVDGRDSRGETDSPEPVVRNSI